MNLQELILLSPYEVPGQYPQMLGDEDVAAFLNGYAILWHPALLASGAGLPQATSPYDHEQPRAGCIYVVPENPPLVLPDDWDQRVRDAGAVAFRATPDRAATLANFRASLAAVEGVDRTLLDVPGDPVRPFFGIGFGYLHVTALFQAMEHEQLLDREAFREDLRQAALHAADTDPALGRTHLQAAAERLLAAREVLYPATIHLLDLVLLADALRAENGPPISADSDAALNVITDASLLERLHRDQPALLDMIRSRVAKESLEVCGGPFKERDDPLLPLESQLWDLRQGLAVSRDLLGTDIHVFARRHFGFHPQLPLLLTGVGLQRCLLISFDSGSVPSFNSAVVNWPAPGGKQVEAFTRPPYAAEKPNTYFHVAHYLHRTIMQDHVATFALLHGAEAAAPWYEDWRELSRLAPVLGQWITCTRYFNEVLAGEQASASTPEELHADFLTERVEANDPRPVSFFARQLRGRRRLDTAATLVALQRALAGAGDPLGFEPRLAELESQFETGHEVGKPLEEIQQEAGAALAARLLSRASDAQPGYLVFNPCSFLRRVPLELDGPTAPIPVGGPVRACQVDADKTRLVIEIPALGFAWFASSGAAGTVQPTRMRLADERHVRNEFFEADIDPETGGLRGLSDTRTRVNRIGQQLVFHPGSTMRAREVRVTSTGPALGEVISEGAIYGDGDQVLATFRQRFRAWLGRPVLDLHIEIFPHHPPDGYPWHAYYGARFAWRDERATLLQGVQGIGSITSHTRPGSPDFLELRQSRQNTTIFPGGLPFAQRVGARMLDVILLPPGESARGFDLALGLDREHPMQTALGLVTPVPLVAVTHGPPHVGPSGWLFHLDNPHLVMTSFRPQAGGGHGVVARLLECGQYGGTAELRCVRDPRHAVLQDLCGAPLQDAAVQGDAVSFDVAANDLVQLLIEFG